MVVYVVIGQGNYTKEVQISAKSAEVQEDLSIFSKLVYWKQVFEWKYSLIGKDPNEMKQQLYFVSSQAVS